MSDFGAPGTDDWEDDIPSAKTKSDKAQYLRLMLDEDTTYNIRLVGKPYVYNKYYANSAPIEAISPGKDHDVCWQAGKDGGGAIPRKRYVIWVIDRADNELKMFEFGATIYKHFKRYHELKGIKPGSKDNAPDWIIRKTIPMKFNEKKGRAEKTPLNTEYSVMHDELTSLTDEELAKVTTLFNANKADGGGFNWASTWRYKPSTAEEIAQLFEESKNLEAGAPTPGGYDWSRLKWASKSAENQNQATPDTAAPEQTSADTAVQAGYEDLFDEKEGDKSTGATDLF